MRPYVIVPCSGEKRRDSSWQRAEDLYTGSLYRLALETAEALTDRWKIGILSAKHGFLRLNDRVEPYDCTWGDPDAATGEGLRNSATRVRPNLNHTCWDGQVVKYAGPVVLDPVVLLLPRAYAERALQVWPEGLWPLRGCRGIGEMRHRLAGLRDGRREVAA